VKGKAKKLKKEFKPEKKKSNLKPKLGSSSKKGKVDTTKSPPYQMKPKLKATNKGPTSQVMRNLNLVKQNKPSSRLDYSVITGTTQTNSTRIRETSFNDHKDNVTQAKSSCLSSKYFPTGTATIDLGSSMNDTDTNTYYKKTNTHERSFSKGGIRSSVEISHKTNKVESVKKSK